MGNLRNIVESFTVSKDFGEPHGQWEVTLKKHWTVGDDEYVTDKQIQLNLTIKEEKPAVDGLSMRFGKVSIVERVLLGWNALDEEGQPVEVNSETIRRLDPIVFDWILAEWQGATAPKVPAPGKGKKKRTSRNA